MQVLSHTHTHTLQRAEGVEGLGAVPTSVLISANKSVGRCRLSLSGSRFTATDCSNAFRLRQWDVPPHENVRFLPTERPSIKMSLPSPSAVTVSRRRGRGRSMGGKHSDLQL